MPLWLAPVQVSVLNISDARPIMCRSCAKLQSGLRVQADLRNEKITYKIREHSVKNCLTSWWATKNGMPIPWPCGRGAMSIWAMSVDALIERLKHEVDQGLTRNSLHDRSTRFLKEQ
jgi:threonyl-tRNA synthetase